MGTFLIWCLVWFHPLDLPIRIVQGTLIILCLDANGLLLIFPLVKINRVSLSGSTAARRRLLAASMTQSWLDMPFHVPLKETFFLFNGSGNLATKGVLKHEKCLEFVRGCAVQTNSRYLGQSTNQISFEKQRWLKVLQQSYLRWAKKEEFGLMKKFQRILGNLMPGELGNGEAGGMKVKVKQQLVLSAFSDAHSTPVC